MSRTAAASVIASEEAPNGKASLDRDYWLAHCEGYRVESPAGRLGLVEEVIPPSGQRPGLLAVRGGLLGRRLLLVPVSDVAFVVPRALRLFLHSAER